jgi:hypothetical protein
MIKKIHVQDIYETEKICAKKNDWTVVISLFDPSHKEVIHRLGNNILKNGDDVTHHIEWFEDLDEEWIQRREFTEEEFEGWLEDPTHYDKEGPAFKHILNIISLGRELISSDIEHRVLVHCHAGVSRSTAVAIILRYLNGSSEGEAVMDTLYDRYCMWPNQLILRIADKILEESELYPTIKIWKKAEKEKPFGCSL